MSRFTVAIVGTGPDPETQTVESFAMGYRHTEAFRNDDRCELVACADIVLENALAFAEEFDIDESGVYVDYEEMVREVAPDVVSIAVPPEAHEEIVVGCAETGAVSAIHCEKPMATTYAGAKRMVDVCADRDVQLTFNRQRRFGRPFTEANRLLEAGEIGNLRRIEIGWGDFFDTGSHTIDLAGMFNDDRPAEWVIAQLDYREEDLRFGVHQENQIWAQWRYPNGVYGVMSSGVGADYPGAAIRLQGEIGEIRIDVPDDGPMLEVRHGAERRTIDVGNETLHEAGTERGRFGSHYHDRAIGDVLDALATGRPSPLRGEIGLQTAAIIFGGYESVRRRGRVALPPDFTDNPFTAMIEAGEIGPEPARRTD